jgi:hypothetical protein
MRSFVKSRGRKVSSFFAIFGNSIVLSNFHLPGPHVVHDAGL